MSIKSDMTAEMITSENYLYTLNHMILRKLKSDYSIYFMYTGRCPSCGSEAEEKKIPHDAPLTDAKFIDNKDYRDIFSDYMKCDRCSSPGNIVHTVPVKTANLFEIQGDNDYHVRMTSTRKKSEGRIIPKFVEKCAGTQKDIRDVLGLKLICETEEDCKITPELLFEYHKDGKDRIKCRDYFEVKERRDKSGKTVLDNRRYFFYLDKKGRPKKQYIDEPLEMKIRHGLDSKGRHIQEPYRGIHMPIEFKGSLIEVQAKDVLQYQKEKDPNSPLYHGDYSKGTSIHHEEFREMKMKAEWGEFERRLADYLYRSRLFADFSPKLYGR
jgi:hypothetical protein